MAVDFSNTLVIAVSASALFDLTESEAKLAQLMAEDPNTATDKFRTYMVERENKPLKAGVSYPLIKGILNLNKYASDFETKEYQDESPLVEVVIVSKSDPDTGVQVMNALRQHKLPIVRSAFLSGDNVAPYIANFKVDLFLTTSHEDAQAVTDAGICACALLYADFVKDNFEQSDTSQSEISNKDIDNAENDNLNHEQLRIAFDGDAVLFDDSGELIYQTDGLKAFHEREAELVDKPIDKGPYADFLIKLSNLQHKLTKTLDNGEKPIKTALVTARSAPADLRAIKTIREWGVHLDMAFFLGGLEKTDVLTTFSPHIFFDDSIKHIERAKDSVPSALVPYHSKSELKSIKEGKAEVEKTRKNKE